MSLTRLYSGKVRDIYDADDGQLLMIASDRISAFDVVFPEPVPDKGRVLTAMTEFWCEALAPIALTHLVTCDPEDFPGRLRRRFPIWQVERCSSVGRRCCRSNASFVAT